MNKTISKHALEDISHADAFNKWMFARVEKYCKNNILEIGSGIGNMSKCILNTNKNVFLSDINASYNADLEALKTKHSNLKKVFIFDAADINTIQTNKSLNKKFNTIICFNVLEHIENEKAFFDNCKFMLEKNGILIVLVPAYKFLYSNFDKKINHYRRYTKKKLHNIFTQNKFKIIKTEYFNFVGIFSWILFMKILKKDEIGKNKMKLYSKLIPVIKLFDILVFRKIGLSVICIGANN